MKPPEGFLAQRETQDALCVMNGSAQNLGVKTEQWMKHVVHTFLSTMHSLNKEITTLVHEHHRAKNGHKMTKRFFFLNKSHPVWVSIADSNTYW